MANMNIGTPRFYTDQVNYYLSKGTAATEFTLNESVGIAAQTGSAAELFDMNPLNQVTFDTTASSGANHVLVNLDMQSERPKSFIAVLNHNLFTARGKIRFFAGNAIGDVDALDGTGNDVDWSAVTTTEAVNADSIITGGSDNSVVVEPAADGSTVFTFTETSQRFWGIQFEGATHTNGASNATNEVWNATYDFRVANILIGEVYSMPHNPDMQVVRNIIMGGNDIVESYSGRRFSNMRWYGRQADSSTLSRSPFATSQYAHGLHSGRLRYDMDFSYLASTDVMPDEYGTIDNDDDNVISDIWENTLGSHIPFIFSIDKDADAATNESEHLFARFSQDSLKMTQVANQIWNLNMSIEEEF